MDDPGIRIKTGTHPLVCPPHGGHVLAEHDVVADKSVAVVQAAHKQALEVSGHHPQDIALAAVERQVLVSDTADLLPAF